MWRTGRGELISYSDYFLSTSCREAGRAADKAATLAAQREVEALKNNLQAAMAPVVNSAVEAAKMALSTEFKIREESLLAQVKEDSQRTLKRVSAIVTQNAEIMEDDAERRMEVDSDGDDNTGPSLLKSESKLKPSKQQVTWWMQARHMSEEFNPEDWKKAKSKPLVKEYTEHPDAKPFKSHEADGEVAIRYKDKKEIEKIYK